MENKQDREWYFYVSPGEHLRLTVNSKTYCRQIEYLVGLGRELVERIPFTHRVVSPPEFRVFTGSRSRGIVGAETLIQASDLSFEEAVARLKAQGFLEETTGVEF